MPRVRDFRPAVLDAYASPNLQVDWKPNAGFEGRVGQLAHLPKSLVNETGIIIWATGCPRRALEPISARS
jgi:hypothetical protein